MGEISPKNTRQVQVTIDMKIEHFDERYEMLLRHGLAHFLKIQPNEIRVKAKEEGSVKITIELPTESAEELLRAYNEDNPRLIEALSQMKLLDISSVTEPDLSSLQDEVLVKKILQNGDDSAFAFKELFVRYHHTVSRMVYLFIRNREDAEDVCMDVWLKLRRNLHRLRKVNQFRVWLSALAKNEASNFMRKSKSHFLLIEPNNPLPSIIEQLEPSIIEQLEPETSKKIDEAISKLPPRLREIIQLKYVDNLTYTEIAERLQIPVGTVKIRTHRAKGSLRKLLDNLE